MESPDPQLQEETSNVENGEEISHEMSDDDEISGNGGDHGGCCQKSDEVSNHYVTVHISNEDSFLDYLQVYGKEFA